MSDGSQGLEKHVRAIVKELDEEGYRLTIATVLHFEKVAKAPRRSEDDPWAPTIERWLQGFDFSANFLTLAAVMRECLGLEQPTRSDATRVGKILHEIGYYKFDARGQARHEGLKSTERFFYKRLEAQK